MGGRDIEQLPPERYRSKAMPLPSHVCRAGLSAHPGWDMNCVQPGMRLEEACKLQSARDRARRRCERVQSGSKHGRYFCAEQRVQGCRVCGKTMPPRLAYVCKDCSCRNSQDPDEQSLPGRTGTEWLGRKEMYCCFILFCIARAGDSVSVSISKEIKWEEPGVNRSARGAPRCSPDLHAGYTSVCSL